MTQPPRPRLRPLFGLLPLIVTLLLPSWHRTARVTVRAEAGIAPQVARRAPPPLGAAPTTCPANPPPTALPHGLGTAIGMSPAWVVGFTSGLTLHLGDPHRLWHDLRGWYRKIAWIIGPRYHQRVTLRGWARGTGTPLWFQIGGEAPLSTAPVLDPQHPGADTPPSQVGWAAFPSYLMIPRAGCYVLQAAWPGGRWRLTFAAGR